MGPTHHLVPNVRFRVAKSTVRVKSFFGRGSFFTSTVNIGLGPIFLFFPLTMRRHTRLIDMACRFQNPIGSLLSTLVYF